MSKNHLEISPNVVMALEAEIDFNCHLDSSLGDVIQDCIVNQYPQYRQDLSNGTYTISLIAIIKPK